MNATFPDRPDPNGDGQRLARVHALRIAKSILRSEIGLVEGTREILPHLRAIFEARDPDVSFLIGLDSETDHLPVGTERKHWKEEALHVKDQQLHEAEEFYREYAETALRQILLRLQTQPSENS
ncbi:MAG: hypothetical protein K8T91_03995 [Planctomycetes bacterium]|nr:hypothetical protein [Planctomycetota bacterium]